MRYIFILLFLLCGCIAVEDTYDPKDPPTLERDGYTLVSGVQLWIARQIDQEAGVVCYVTHDGIDCLPISETDLEIGE